MSSSRMKLVQTGRASVPMRLVVYGPGGAGKTSFLADAPGALFFDLEGGSHHVDVQRYSFHDGPDGTRPRTYAAILAGLDDVKANARGSVKLLVIDTLSVLESMLVTHVCAEAGKASIEDFGYGRGYRYAEDCYRAFLSRLDELRTVGISVAIIAHSKVAKFRNPEGEDYDRYQIAAHDLISTLTYQWADVVGFLRFEDFSKKGKAFSAGARVLHLARTAAFDAKSRTGAQRVDVGEAHPWAAFAASQDAAAAASAASLMTEIEAELERIGDSFEVNGKKWTRTDLLASIKGEKADVLTRVINGLRTIEGDKQS